MIISNGIERRWKRKKEEREREVKGKDEMKAQCDRAKTDGKRRSKKEKENKKEK